MTLSDSAKYPTTWSVTPSPATDALLVTTDLFQVYSCFKIIFDDFKPTVKVKGLDICYIYIYIYIYIYNFIRRLHESYS